MSGVTDTGCVAKTIEEIKSDIEADELATIDAGLNLQADQPIGQLNAIFAKKCAELWELGVTAYNAFNREAAEKAQLDNVGTLTGTPRLKATKSKVTCTVNLNAGFSCAAGAMLANVAGQSARWTNLAAVGPVASTGNYSVDFVATDYGPTVANAGTLTVKTNSISGWNSITNPLDAALGTVAEEDPDYRQRQEDELSAAGSSTTDAIRADLLKVAKVLQAFCFENVTQTADANGVPAHGIECVIYDGDTPSASDTEIAQAIWDSKPSGCETYGHTSAIAIDKLGIQRTVYFSRATVVPIWLEFDVSADAETFPTDGTTLVKDDAVAKGNSLNLGDQVVALVIRASALAVPGVKDVVALRLGTSSSPTGTTNLAIGSRAIARFDTSRVLVNLV